jgi:hypothetical protein
MQVGGSMLSVVDTALECLAAQDGVTPGEAWGRMRDDLVLLDILIGERFLENTETESSHLPPAGRNRPSRYQRGPGHGSRFR